MTRFQALFVYFTLFFVMAAPAIISIIVVATK